MTVPLLSTRTTNVELTPKRRDLLKGKLFPLTRYMRDTSIAYFDVLVRQESKDDIDHQFYLSVKLSTTTSRYIAVSVAGQFEQALLDVRDTIKRQLQQDTARGRYAKSDWSFDEVQIA